MKTEGYFTNDEISSAAVAGAAVCLLEYGRTLIEFQSSEQYEQWANSQAKLRPDRWSHCIRLTKSESNGHL